MMDRLQAGAWLEVGSTEVAVRLTEGRGRHIVCRAFIPSGKIIARVPVIVVPQEEVNLLRRTLLFNYVFEWDPQERYRRTGDLVQCDGRYGQGVALGLISLCNHSETPNSDYEFDYENNVILWRAVRDIAPGEEVTLHYKVPIWFEMLDEPAAEPQEALA